MIPVHWSEMESQRFPSSVMFNVASKSRAFETKRFSRFFRSLISFSRPNNHLTLSHLVYSEFPNPTQFHLNHPKPVTTGLNRITLSSERSHSQIHSRNFNWQTSISSFFHTHYFFSFLFGFLAFFLVAVFKSLLPFSIFFLIWIVPNITFWQKWLPESLNVKIVFFQSSKQICLSLARVSGVFSASKFKIQSSEFFSLQKNFALLTIARFLLLEFIKRQLIFN